MHISITGGLGFIGSALGTALSEAGHDVRLSDIHDQGIKQDMDYFQGSVLNADDCNATCDGMDVVIHCAAIHDAKVVAKNYLSSIEINVTGTLNLLNAAISSDVKRLIYLSTAKVYGDPKILPSTELDIPIPRETYALSKITSEYYCHTLQARSNLDIVIIRPFSVYGPAQELGSGYVGMILSSILSGTELRLPGRPDFIRDFIHIDDVTSLCLQAATADLPGVTTLNAGSGQQTSLCDLLRLASEILGFDLDSSYHEPGPETIMRMQACMKHAEAALGYRPRYDLREGLTKTIEWFLQNRSKAEKAVGR
jgi:nucleoside-diphosphate-sugar epimerase